MGPMSRKRWAMPRNSGRSDARDSQRGGTSEFIGRLLDKEGPAGLRGVRWCGSGGWLRRRKNVAVPGSQGRVRIGEDFNLHPAIPDNYFVTRVNQVLRSAVRS